MNAGMNSNNENGTSHECSFNNKWELHLYGRRIPNNFIQSFFRATWFCHLFVRFLFKLSFRTRTHTVIPCEWGYVLNFGYNVYVVGAMSVECDIIIVIVHQGVNAEFKPHKTVARTAARCYGSLCCFFWPFRFLSQFCAHFHRISHFIAILLSAFYFHHWLISLVSFCVSDWDREEKRFFSFLLWIIIMISKRVCTPSKWISLKWSCMCCFFWSCRCRRWLLPS